MSDFTPVTILCNAACSDKPLSQCDMRDLAIEAACG
jgi:hypothetical protein